MIHNKTVHIFTKHAIFTTIANDRSPENIIKIYEDPGVVTAFFFCRNQ